MIGDASNLQHNATQQSRWNVKLNYNLLSWDVVHMHVITIISSFPYANTVE